MKRKMTENEEMVSLNSEFTEFNLQELEQRLETDPLAVGGLLELASSHDLSQHIMNVADEECTCSRWSHNK